MKRVISANPPPTVAMLMPAICKFTGLPLPANLINDSRGRPNIYRYRKPCGKLEQIEGTYAEVVELANLANTKRGTSTQSSASIGFWVARYIEWMEGQNKDIKHKRGWNDRKASLNKFAREQRIPLRQVSIEELSTWWDALTYDQQHNRRSNYSQFFQWSMSKGVAKSNPFNKSDAVAHLIEKKKPSKRRLPIVSMAEFNAIYEHAAPEIQIAMMISLTTTMRAGDIVELTFENSISNSQLQKTINKSSNQRGAMAAAHLSWSLAVHIKLAQTIKIARELSLKNRRCPYIVSKRPQRLRLRKGCAHSHQCISKDLSRGFTAAAEACGLWGDIPGDRTAPTFHEVRGFAIDRLLKAGVDIKQVQKLAAHTDESVTSAYTANHDPVYLDMGIVVDDGVLGQ